MDATTDALAPSSGGPTSAPVAGGWTAVAGRCLAFAMAAAVVVWTGVIFSAEGTAERFDLALVAEHLMNGEPYSPDVLEGVDQRADPWVVAAHCDSRGFQNLAVVRIARVEQAVQADDPDAADRLLTAAETAARRSLACNPGASVSWIVLAWIEFLRNEDTPQLRRYLEMSDLTGPFEGWPMVRRTELLLRLLPGLDAPEKARLREQLKWLVGMGGLELVVEIYLKSGPEQQALLRDIFAATSSRDQKRVAEIVRNAGGDIVLPEVEPMGSRPWR